MIRSRTALLVAAASVVAFAAACGGDATPTATPADRTVKVTMTDMAFEPATIAVRQGETVRFVFDNTGKVAHDAFIGDAMAQADHEKEMRDADEMHHGGGSDDAITVDPGETGELLYAFHEAAAVEIGCHQPGHYRAGMKLAVKVT